MIAPTKSRVMFFFDIRNVSIDMSPPSGSRRCDGGRHGNSPLLRAFDLAALELLELTGLGRAI
jgi:hypothetical protein